MAKLACLARVRIDVDDAIRTVCKTATAPSRPATLMLIFWATDNGGNDEGDDGAKALHLGTGMSAISVTKTAGELFQIVAHSVERQGPGKEEPPESWKEVGRLKKFATQC